MIRSQILKQPHAAYGSLRHQMHWERTSRSV